MSKPRGRWKCIWSCVAVSQRLGQCSLLADVIYTWGIPVSDMYGVLRRKDVRPSILPNRKGVGLVAINAAVDELIGLKLLCQPQDGGELHLHWCFHDDYQGEKVRKGRGSPLFEFVCPNEERAIVRDTARDSAAPRPTKTKTKTKTETKTETEKGRSVDLLPANGIANS